MQFTFFSDTGYEKILNGLSSGFFRILVIQF